MLDTSDVALCSPAASPTRRGRGGDRPATREIPGDLPGWLPPTHRRSMPTYQRLLTASTETGDVRPLAEKAMRSFDLSVVVDGQDHVGCRADASRRRVGSA